MDEEIKTAQTSPIKRLPLQETDRRRNSAKTNTLIVIDEFNDDEGDQPGTRLIGRTKGDAPGIDGQVYLYAGDFAGQIKIGDIVQARIEDSDEYDLYGEVVERPEWRPNVPLLGHFGKH